MNKEKSCGAIVIDDDKQILLVHQLDGHYSFPKGHVELHETEEETAIRETKEETNVDIEIISNKRFVIHYLVKNNVDKEVVYFLAKPLNKDILPELKEISEVKWIDIGEVNNYLDFENINELWTQKIIGEINKIF